MNTEANVLGECGRKTTHTEPERTRRRRPKPDAAEAEILSAAEDFLRELPVWELTVDSLMARTGLARPSFYEYFRDRSYLIVKLTERLGAQNRAIADRWLAGHESHSDLRKSIRDLAELYASEGHLCGLCRMPLAATEYSKLAIGGYWIVLIAAIARKVRTEMEAAVATVTDAREVATALVLMNERYLAVKLGRRPQVKTKIVAETLTAIWLRVLYGIAQ